MLDHLHFFLQNLVTQFGPLDISLFQKQLLLIFKLLFFLFEFLPAHNIFYLWFILFDRPHNFFLQLILLIL